MILNVFKESNKQISQQFTRTECDLLSRLANRVSPEQIIMIVGENPALLLENLDSFKPGSIKLAGVSLYGISAAPDEQDNIITEQKKAEIEDTYRMTLFMENAADLSRRWKDPIGLLIVMYHEFSEEVKATVACWQGFLPPEAAVVIIDGHKPGPGKAVNELVNDNGNFNLHESCENITVLRIDQCRHHWAINSNDIGQCKNCGRTRNFKRMQKESMNMVYRKKAITSTLINASKKQSGKNVPAKAGHKG